MHLISSAQFQLIYSDTKELNIFFNFASHVSFQDENQSPFSQYYGMFYWIFGDYAG